MSYLLNTTIWYKQDCIPCDAARSLKLEAAPGRLGCLLDPLDGLVAAIVDDAGVEAHELLPAALLVALEVVAAGALVGVHGVSLADAVCNVGALTQGHREGAHR